MRGASGALGDELVFKQRAGKTVISLPQPPRIDNPTNAQLAVRSKFREAERYAKAVIADPVLKATYLARAEAGVSAYNMAISDFLRG